MHLPAPLPDRRVVPSVCPLDCPDRCSLDVTVEAGRVVKIAGNRVNPVTDDFICGKVSRFAERVHGPDRLLTPLRRTGPKGSGAFAPISWDDAISEIVGRFLELRARHGGESILPLYYSGSNGMLTDGTFDTRWFRLLGASRLDRTVCAAPTGAAAKALFGKMPGVPFEDYPLAKLAVIWGGNPAASNIHLLPYLKELRRRGGRVVLVDPRRTFDGIDLHLPLYPGTDLALALAMIAETERRGLVARDFLAKHARGTDELLARARGWTLERAAETTRLALADLRRFADLFFDADPAVVRCGWGPERNRNAEGAIAAILALPAIAGKLGKRGGGWTASTSGSYRVDEELVARIPAPATRVVNMSRVARALEEEQAPPIRGLFVYNANPMVTVPDQNRFERALANEELFTVVSDQVMTDTALFGDVVLPATTFLEHRELSKSYGVCGLQYAEAAIPPVGESLPNEELFRRLGRATAAALGTGRELFEESDEEILARAVASIRGPLSREDGAVAIRPGHFVPMDFPGPVPIPFVNVFPQNDDRKIDLAASALGPEVHDWIDLPDDPAHPLALISPASHRTITSTCGEYNLPEARLEMNPADAAARGVADGDPVRIWNGLGEVRAVARVVDTIRPGVVSLPKGLWRKASRNGKTSTALIPDAVTRVVGGATWNDARVQVARD